jgi:hypothetical protein
MKVRGTVVALVFVASFAPARADAEADRPMFVTVVGHESIRFRLAIGRTAPCDSSENRMLFDAWLGPGRYEWGTGANLVCYQHTSGVLRESNWSESRVVPTLISMGRGWPARPAEIVVSTD